MQRSVKVNLRQIKQSISSGREVRRTAHWNKAFSSGVRSNPAVEDAISLSR
jgi:hypothetical protein